MQEHWSSRRTVLSPVYEEKAGDCAYTATPRRVNIGRLLDEQIMQDGLKDDGQEQRTIYGVADGGDEQPAEGRIREGADEVCNTECSPRAKGAFCRLQSLLLLLPCFDLASVQAVSVAHSCVAGRDAGP